MSMISIAAGVVASLASMQSANNVSNPGGVITSFDVNTVAPMRREMGWATQVNTMSSGEKFLAVTASNGIKFGMRPTVCQSTGRCLGVFILAPFPAADGNRIFAFNNAVPFIKASSYGNQGSYVARYEIADGGYVRGNFRFILTNFASVAGDYQRTMGGMSVSVDPDKVLTDFSADSLNRREADKDALLAVNFEQTFGGAHSGADVEVADAIEAAFSGEFADTLVNKIEYNIEN